MIIKDGFGYKCSHCGCPINLAYKCPRCGTVFSNYDKLKKEKEEEEEKDDLFFITAVNIGD